MSQQGGGASSNGNVNKEDNDRLCFQVVCDPGHDRTTRELSALARESRERVWADMIGATSTSKMHQNHPISQSIEDEEAPIRLEDKLTSMDLEIQSLPPGQGRDLILGTALGQARDCRLTFLRASMYNPREAVRRLSKHLECKVALFGRDKVEEQIFLKDLSDDDLVTLKCGAMQFLPQTDRGGRLVFVSRYQELVYEQPDNILRALWYMWMSTMEMPSVVKDGIVVVGYEVGDSQVAVQYETLRQMLVTAESLPVRVKAAHSCYSDHSPMAVAGDLVVHMVNSFVRRRLRLHHGSHQECRDRLFSVGIPVHLLPVTLSGELLLIHHKIWMDTRMRQEKIESGNISSKRYQMTAGPEVNGMQQRIDDTENGDNRDGMTLL